VIPRSFRYVRHRWGIAAPRLAVRTHVPWYWYALLVVAVLMIAITAAMWMYDAGRRFAGIDAAAYQSEIAQLRGRVAELEVEARQLRDTVTSNESRMQIEKSAAGQLARQLKAAETEIARLREDVAFFDNLAVREGDERLAVSGFKVERDALPGEYRYRVLLTHGGRPQREFKGRLQFIVSSELRGREATVVIPEDGQEDAAPYRVSFRRFYRAEGSFKIDPNATVRSVQVRVFEQGAEQPRVTQNHAML
jgi:hypothetical protein